MTVQVNCPETVQHTYKEHRTMFTFDQTLTALHDVVDADPNVTNAQMGGCYLFEFTEGNAHDYDCHKPMCVVGHVLTRLNVACDTAWDNNDFVNGDRQRLCFEEHFDKPAVDLLAAVQWYADDGDGTRPWGEALTLGHDEFMEQLLGDDPS